MDLEIVDFAKERKDLYAPKSEPVIVDVPDMLFLMMHGEGMPDPTVGTKEDKGAFTRTVGAIYGLAYAIKMSDRKGNAPRGYYNFKVPPLEALWWVPEGADLNTAKPDEWRWTAMVRVPEYVTQDVIDLFADELAKKKKDNVYTEVLLENYHEGPSVQLMHIGSYDSEGPNIAKMHEYAEEQGYKLHGKHHEIYFNDPRRVAPEKLKTILRQPIQRQ